MCVRGGGRGSGSMANVYYRVDSKRVGRGGGCRWHTCGKGGGVGGSMANMWEGAVGVGVHVSTHLSSIMYLCMSRKALRAVTGQVL